MRSVVQGKKLPLGRFSTQFLTALMVSVSMLAAWPQKLSASQDVRDLRYTQEPLEELQKLVAPIALYPDSLVSQILSASTFPGQVVEADKWVQAHRDLNGDALGQAVDPQPWDLSVKALTPFPSVLGNMDKNLNWTSSLGDAYYNQRAVVMDAIQFMRGKAQEGGSLRATPQQSVTTSGSEIIIEPQDPEVVYIPAYDPWLAYGYPIAEWSGWYPDPEIWSAGSNLSFGVGTGIGEQASPASDRRTDSAAELAPSRRFQVQLHSKAVFAGHHRNCFLG